MELLLSIVCCHCNIGSDILLGNLYAICASALFAIYLTYSKDIISDDYPLYFYWAVNSGYTIVITYFLSVFTENEIDLFSVDPTTGFLSFTTNSYIPITHRNNFLYAIVGLGLFGFLFLISQIKAKAYLSHMFVDICFNFVPLMGEILTFLMELQLFPSIWSAYGALCLFVGCTILSMNDTNRIELVKTPLTRKPEVDYFIEPMSSKFNQF